MLGIVMRFSVFVLVFVVLGGASIAEAVGASACREGDDIHIRGGGVLMRRVLSGVTIRTISEGGVCYIDALEGVFWWDGMAASPMPNYENNGWVPVKVVFSYFHEGCKNDVCDDELRGWLRQKEWKGENYSFERVRRAGNKGGKQRLG